MKGFVCAHCLKPSSSQGHFMLPTANRPACPKWGLDNNGLGWCCDPKHVCQPPKPVQLFHQRYTFATARPINEPLGYYPVCGCGHRYDAHRHHGTECCYECKTCPGYHLAEDRPMNEPADPIEVGRLVRRYMQSRAELQTLHEQHGVKCAEVEFIEAQLCAAVPKGGRFFDGTRVISIEPDNTGAKIILEDVQPLPVEE